MRSADFSSTSAPSLFARVRQFFSFTLSLTLAASALTIISANPAFAYSSCGNILGNNAGDQSLIDNTAKITIKPEHGTIFYVDTRRGINASYVAYKITNTATSTKKNLWVKLSSFTAASGSSVVALANPADNLQQIPSLASNASTTVYFLLTANKSTTVTQTHSVEVFTADPRLSSTGAASTGCDYTFNRVDQTIAANANKVTSVFRIPFKMRSAMRSACTRSASGATFDFAAMVHLLRFGFNVNPDDVPDTTHRVHPCLALNDREC